MLLASNASNVGFIVHRGDTKDGTDADRFFNPGEHVTIPFEIGLVKKRPFLFLVSAYGILVDGGLTRLSLESLDVQTGLDVQAGHEFEFDIAAEDFERGTTLYLPLIFK